MNYRLITGVINRLITINYWSLLSELPYIKLIVLFIPSHLNRILLRKTTTHRQRPSSSSSLHLYKFQVIQVVFYVESIVLVSDGDVFQPQPKSVDDYLQVTLYNYYKKCLYWSGRAVSCGKLDIINLRTYIVWVYLASQGCPCVL